MNYKDSLEGISLSAEAKQRILSRLEERGKHAERRSPVRIGLIAAVPTLALACAVAVPVLLSLPDGSVTDLPDGSVTSGLPNGDVTPGDIAPGDATSGDATSDGLGFGGGALGKETGNSEVQLFTPLYCGYLFQTNVYEKSAVEATLLFGIDEGQFSYLVGHDFARHGEMVEFSLVVGVYNYDIRGGEEFYGAEAGDYADGAQIYYAETFSDYTEVDLAEYAVDLETKETGEGIVCGNETYYVFYSKQLEVQLPEELFIGESGRIDFFFYNYIKYADGTEGFYAHAYNGGPPCFFYKVEGDKVRLFGSKP